MALPLAQAQSRSAGAGRLLETPNWEERPARPLNGRARLAYRGRGLWRVGRRCQRPRPLHSCGFRAIQLSTGTLDCQPVLDSAGARNLTHAPTVLYTNNRGGHAGILAASGFAAGARVAPARTAPLLARTPGRPLGPMECRVRPAMGLQSMRNRGVTGRQWFASPMDWSIFFFLMTLGQSTKNRKISL